MEPKRTPPSPLQRRKFFKTCARILAGGTIVGLFGLAYRKSMLVSDACFWQIDPAKCTFCGRCQTDCVLPASAVKCVHAVEVCGYCDLCGGYYRSNARELNTAAENQLCPTGAIQRKYVEDPYFEYSINEALCNGCGKCAKGCNSFGNGSLYLQIKQELCSQCNQCQIAQTCPANAVYRVSAEGAYSFK